MIFESDAKRDDKLQAISEHVKAIMIELNTPPETEGTLGTPDRVARMLYDELFRARTYPQEFIELCNHMTSFENELDGAVFLKDIKFSSICEHHLMPFFGYIDIAYTPDKSILGISKFARAIHEISAQPQVQERFTKTLGEFLVYVLKPKRLDILVHDVTHTCASLRGARSSFKTNTEYHFVREENEDGNSGK